MKEKQQEKEIYFQDEVSLGLIKNGIDETKKRLEGIVAEWKKLTKRPLTMELVTSFVNGSQRDPLPEVIRREARRERAEKSPFFGEIDLEKLMDIIPAVNDRDWIEAVGRLREYIPGPRWKDLFSPQCFRIEGDRVEIVAEEVGKLKKRYSWSVTSEAEEIRYIAVRRIIDALENIVSKFPKVSRSALVIPGLVTVSNDGTRFFASRLFVEDAVIPGTTERMTRESATAPIAV